ncbi:MAG: SUF system NifU family Fe-S cluster assembly protein [Ilumatobacteraceae bacterium]
MPGLEDLYREIILDHYRTPRNRGKLPVPPARHAEGHNPLCGDEITVFLDVTGEGPGAVVNDVKVSGQGCSISQSSASMMSAAVKGKSVAEVKALVHKFKGMMSIDVEGEPAVDVPLGDLEALQGVVKFPVRIKCATLAWNTLVEALESAPSDS